MTYLLDTNVLSETRRRTCNPGVRDWISTTPPERLHLSALTIGELERGITRLVERGDQRQAAALGEWLDDIVQQFGARILPVTGSVARQWGRQSTARAVSVVDALLAATVLVHGWTMVTRNTKDFEPTGVRLLNPFS